jgi:hypothetical protein
MFTLQFGEVRRLFPSHGSVEQRQQNDYAKTPAAASGGDDAASYTRKCVTPDTAR